MAKLEIHARVCASRAIPWSSLRPEAGVDHRLGSQDSRLSKSRGHCSPAYGAVIVIWSLGYGFGREGSRTGSISDDAAANETLRHVVDYIVDLDGSVVREVSDVLPEGAAWRPMP